MADTQAALLARWAELQAKADAVEDFDRQAWFGEAAAFLQTTDHWWCQHAALTGDTLPGSLITALFEVLSFPDLMDDVRVNGAVESALLHLKQSHELALTDGGRYQGLYRLMAHPSPQIRAMVHPMIKTLGPLEDAPDVDSIAPVLQNWADLMRSTNNPGQSEHCKGRFVQPPQLVWLAMNVLLTLIKPKAMVALLEQVWQYTESDAHALVQSIIRSCYESQDTRVHRAGIHALTAAVKACWNDASMSGDMMLDGSYASRISHKRIASCMVQHSNNSWVDGEDQMQQMVQQVVAFLLQGIPSTTSFASATHNMAVGSAFGLLTDCLQQGLPTGKAVALWGPSLCRTLQQAPANGTAPNLHAACHLALLAMASDAHALHHWNQQEWGQTHTSKTTAASLTSDSCSPALWEGLLGCLPATAPVLAAAAHLAFTTAATSSPGQKAGPSSGGFHSIGSPALPQEVQLAMHWHQHGAAADEAASSVRVAKYPGVLLGLFRQCAASHLQHILQSGQATLPREAIADLLLVMVGVQPRLRELTQQLLLAVTNAGAVEEAVLVLMTDAVADTAAQVVAAAEKLVPMLQHAPAAQVLTRAPTMHIFDLLAAMLAADTSSTRSTAAVVVPQLWSAVIGILQHGAAAAKLSVVLKSLHQPVEQALPEDVLSTAANILAPNAGLPDKPRLLLAPFFGHAAPGNLGMTSSLLHLPSRATSSPPPSSSSSPVEASPTTRPASSSVGSEPIPGTAPKKKQSSLTAFLSPAAKQQQTAAQADALAASQSAAGSEGVIEFLGGHSQEFIEQSWQQRLHGRQPSEPPVVIQQQISHRQQQQQQQKKKNKKTAEQLGAVTKERGVKRPLEFPEDIDALLPPEWGGKAAKPDKPKGKGKLKGKVSLTAQYLHPDTVQHPLNSAMQDRPLLLSRSGASATAKQPQPPPHTRPSAAAAVASASRQFEAQQAQQAQQGQSSSVPWFSSSSNAAKQQQPQSPVKKAHSFGDWLSPPWGQSHPQGNALSLPSSSSHPSRLYGADAGALPLPVQSHSQSQQRLGQLTAMHHRPALQFQSGDSQTTTNESTKHNLRPPPSRSPSPVLMEDEDFDAQLTKAAGEKGPGQRAYVGLPSAPAPEPSRRAQMISIPAAANTSVGLTIQEVQRDLLIWDYHSIIRASPEKGLKTLGMKRVPTQFQGLQDYCRVFRVLLLEELKAHLLQAEEEQQRPSSKGSSATALAQLRAMQRRSDLEAVRGEDLLLLTHSLGSEGIRSDTSGAGQHEAALLAIVEKVESAKELDGSRKLVAYATVCLAGMVRKNPIQQPMSPKVVISEAVKLREQ
ncbi:MAG: hypothetical protein FRX49_11515 [Trebouxia sp. A1-2]|nr:MAG: hypothetical protein FRX49_11515 [Trebouxia sp. A1-2]